MYTGKKWLGYYVPWGEKRYVLTKVRSIQNAIFLTGRTGSTSSLERSAMEDASPPWVAFIINNSLFVRWNCLSEHRELENGLENWNRNWKVGWHALDQKKRTTEGQKVLPAGKLVRNIRFCATFWMSYPKKFTYFPIGNVRNRRTERYNRVYILSCVRTNRVSLYMQ